MEIKSNICISRPPALCLAPGPGHKFDFTGPGPKFVFTGPGTKFVIFSPGPKFVFTIPGSQFVFTGSDHQFVFTPNLYLPAQPGLSLHIPTLSPQFVFTGPGLWFLRTQAAKLIYHNDAEQCNQQYSSLQKQMLKLYWKNGAFQNNSTA